MKREIERAKTRMAALSHMIKRAPVPVADLLTPEAAGEVIGGAIDLIKWLAEPAKYKDWVRDKKPDRLEEVNLPEDEPNANAPEVTASITSAGCLEGWIHLKIRVDAAAGADNDDITRVRLGLPAVDCRGYRYRRHHVFAEEEEEAWHEFSVRVKCSDLISRSETKVDVFLWTQVTAIDDDGNSRTVYMKLSSPGLDTAVEECCRKPSGSGEPPEGSPGNDAPGAESG